MSECRNAHTYIRTFVVDICIAYVQYTPCGNGFYDAALSLLDPSCSRSAWRWVHSALRLEDGSLGKQGQVHDNFAAAAAAAAAPKNASATAAAAACCCFRQCGLSLFFVI